MKIMPTLLLACLLPLTLTAHAEKPSTDTGVAGVDHVGLVVSDLEASKQLFLDVLGFTIRGSDPKYPAYFLTNGQSTITLWQAKDPKTATPFNRKTNIGLHHLALRIDSEQHLNQLYQRLQKHPGVRIEFAPELAYGGPDKHMMFYEPSGNRIELVFRPQR